MTGEGSRSSSSGSAGGPRGEAGAQSPSPPGGPDSGGGAGSDPVTPARQLSKLKRFLTTLQQLGADISSDIGDSVHALVLALVVSYRYV